MKRVLLILLALCLLSTPTRALDAFSNFGLVTVSTGYDATATTIQLSSGQGARLPTAAFRATWYNARYEAADDPDREIVRCTRSGDILTCDRGYEDGLGNSPGTAVAHNTAGETYKMVNAITAATMTAIAAGLGVGGGSCPTDTDDASIAGGQSVCLSGDLTMVWNGSAWVRLTVGTAGSPATTVLSVQGVVGGTDLPVNPYTTPAAATYLVNRLSDGTNYITPGTDYTHDAALTTSTTAGPMGMCRASAAAPTNVSADDDATLIWCLKNGSPVVNIAASGSLIGATANALDVNIKSGSSSGTQYTQDAALTVATSVGTMAMGRASAAAPTDVSADNDAVLPWYLKSGAQVTNLSAAGVLIGATSTSLNVAVTNIPLAGVSGFTAHDAAGSGISPLLIGGYANAAAPADVSTDLDVVRAWYLKNGSQVVNIAAAGALIGATSNALDVNIKSGSSSGTQYTQDAALTVATSVGTMAMGRASAAVPTDVSADNDAVLPWYLRSGALAIQPTFGGVLTSTGNGASGTGVQRVTLANDSTGIVALTTGSAQIGHLEANQSSNVAQINGVTPLMGNGASGTGAQRVTIANDSTGIIALTTGTAQIGHLEANQSSNIAQINGVTPLMGNGASGTGAQRVTIANDSTGIIALTTGSAQIGHLEANQSSNIAQMNGVTVTMGAGATGTGVQRVNDVGSSATGAAPPASAHFIGGLASGATGGFLTGVPVCDSVKAVSMTSATTTLMVTGVSGRHVRICSIHLLTAIANNVALIGGTGATCGTGTSGLAGGTTAANGWNFGANGGLALGSGIGTVIQTAATGDSVCLITSAAGPLAGTIAYTIY